MNHHHLTVEQMETLLSNPAVRSTHLQTCSLCAQEFESLRALLSGFRSAVIASADVHRHVAVMPAPAHRMPNSLWSLVAATLILCVAVPAALHRRIPHAGIVPAAAQELSSAASGQQLSDEQLLSDVQQDLSTSASQGILPITANEPSAAGSISGSKENE